MPRLRWACAAALLALAGGVSPAGAQTVQVQAGTTARAQVAAGDKVQVPITIDLSAAGGRTLAQLLAGITWGTNRLTYDSLRVTGAAGLSVLTDASAAASGTLSLQATWGTPLSGNTTLLTLFFTAGPPSGGARVALTPTGATDGAAADILSLVRAEAHEVCVAFPARWGDVNGAGGVNIIDAQQIARWATGLTVTNAALVVRRGDVNALNGVNIVDAQQVARWATGLTVTAPRINTILLEYPTANNIVMSPTSANVTEGVATTLVATVRDSVNNSLAGCYPVTWSTSNASVATVSSAGNVTAVAPGSATITATSGSLSAAATITVGQRATTLTALSAVTQDGTAGAPVATPPSVKVTDVRGDPVAGVTVTFAVATGGGSVGTATATSGADGIATLDSWTLGTSVGSNTLTASVSGLTGSPITFTATALAGTASQLVLTTQPSGAVSGVALTAQPVVEVRDQYGNRVATSNAAITVARASGTGTLSGTATVNAVNGVATFTGLTLSGPGSHALSFSTGSLAVTSSAFTVTQVAASLALTTQPAGAVSGAAFTAQPVVEIRDNAGLTVTTGSGATLAVSVVIASGTGTLGGTASATATSGVATFAGLTIAQAGAFTLQFTTASPSLSVTSSSFTVSAGAASQLLLTTGAPATARSGVGLSSAPVVTARDAANNPVAGLEVVVSAPSGWGLAGTTTRTTGADGTATFSGLTISGTAGTKQLTFASASPALSVPSGNIALGAGPASQLVLTTQPGGGASGGVLTTQPVVQVRDASGNALDTALTVSAAIATQPGSGATVANGTAATGGTSAATFSGLGITGAAGSYTLTFSAGALSVTSSSLSLTAGAAASIAVAGVPAMSRSGQAFSTVPVATVRDGASNPVPGVAVAVTLTTGTGTLLGTTSGTTDANGQVTFTGLGLTSTTLGSRSLTFAVSSGPSTSESTTLKGGVATQLAVTTQPSASATNAVVFGTQPVVQLKDASGNLTDSATTTVTAAVVESGAVLGGTLTAGTGATGAATFSDLKLTGTVGTYTLRFTAPGLTSADADGLTLGAGAATQLGVATQPSGSAQSGVPFTQQPAVQLRDVSGNAVAQAGVEVSAGLASGTGTLGGTATATTGATGQATFSNLSITGTAGSTYTLALSASGLTGTTSSTITLSAGAATTLAASSTTNQSAVVGTAVGAPPSVAVTDASGNPVAGVSVTFAVASGGGSVTGASATTDASGIATVGSWTLGTTVGANTLTATSEGLTGSPVTFSATGTQTTLTVGGSVTAEDKVYDGTTVATGTTTGLALVGVASGDAVTINTVTLAFATAGAGVGKTVSITGLTLGGAQAYRYVVSLVGAPTATANITPAASSVTVTGSTSFTYTGTPQGPATADVTGSTGVITYSYEGTGTTTYGPSVTAPTNAGTYAVTAAVAADANYATASSAAYAFTIAQAALTVTADNQSVPYGTAVATVTGAGTSLLAGFVAGETVAVVSGTVTYTTSYTATTNAATAGVTITPVVTGLAAANYRFTPVAGTVTITQASQTITFGDAPTVVVGGTGAVSATATSGLLVSFTSTTAGVCTVAGTTVTGVTAGDCTIEATQAGNTNYAAATPVTQTFAVGRGPSTVTVTGDTVYTYNGSAQGPTTVTRSGSTGALTWSYAGRPGTTYAASATRPTNAGEYSATATVAADANYNGASSAAFDFRIAPAAQAALTLMVDPTSVAVGGTAALSTTGGSGTGAVSYAVATGGTVCSVSGATLTAVTPGTCTVTATKAADANYLEVTSAATTVTVYGDAAALTVSREPAGAVSGAAFTTQPLVEIRDAGGRRVTSSTVAVTAALASGTGSLSGTATVSAVAGVATFTNLVITGGGPHTLSFTVTGLTSATSGSFTVTLPDGATVSKVSATALSGYTSNFIANPPAVRILTSGGTPIPGVAVSWATDAGSLVQRNSSVTDATGTAALLGWQLGSSAGTQTASATVTDRTPLNFAATVTAPPASQFNITLRYLGTEPSAERQGVFEAAAARWSQLIVGDLAPVTINRAADPDGCYPALSETVDDVLIFVTIGPVDGPGLVLGGARPCLARTSDSLPVVGEMVFDEDDLPALEADGQFDEVILHEMGHVLGVGSIWSYKGKLTGAGTPDPYFTGSTARAAFIAATGISGFVGNIVPVENTGGAGTRDSHWRETVFDNELMTGYLGAGTAPLSAISVASLRDLGYVVNDAAADAFSLEAGIRLPGGPGRQLRELPFDKPIRVIDPTGRVVRTIIPR